MTATLIEKNLWLGDLTGAHFFQGAHLCMRDQTPPEYMFPTQYDVRLPFEYGAVTQEMLDAACRHIDSMLEKGIPLIVHCSGGIHRSALTVVYWLHSRKGMSINDAYELVQNLRPEVERRDHWLVRAGIVAGSMGQAGDAGGKA